MTERGEPGADWASPYRKFDAHAHVLGPKRTATGIFDGTGVAGALNVSVSGFREPGDLKIFEERLLEDSEAYPGRYRFATSFTIRAFESPSYASETVAKLEEDFERRGAVAVKIWKDIGMQLTDAEGRYIFCDDARFKPVFDYLADRNAVVVMHLGDPKAAWQPLDPGSSHYKYFRDHPEYHWHGRTDRPSHEELMRRRDTLVERYPYVRFVCAHLASLEHDVDEVGAFLHRFPNACVDTSARQGDLAMQPVGKVRRLFERYADRILYGSDWGFHPKDLKDDREERAEQVAGIVRGFQRVFRYYEETLGLSGEVLERFYLRNAERVFGNV